MDSDEILEMVKDGELDPEEIEDFQNLDEELQDLTASGDITPEDAIELGG